MSWDEAVAKLAQPARPELDRVLGQIRRVLAASGFSSGSPPSKRDRNWRLSPGVVDEAWETAAPVEWLSRRGRAYWPPVPFRRPAGPIPLADSLRTQTAESPESLELIAALTSDPAGVVTAEELALEFAERMAPWPGPLLRPDDQRGGGELVVWSLMDPWFSADPSARTWESMSDPLDIARAALASADDALGYAGNEVQIERAAACVAACRDEAARRKASGSSARGPWAALLRQLSDVLLEALRWRDCCSVGAALPPTLAAALGARRFVDTPSPYDPLLGILELGYVPMDYREGAVVLGTVWPGPMLSAPTWRSLLGRS